MSNPEDGYSVLVSLATREEAEIAASALRANGVGAFVGNADMANMYWGAVQAMGGLQVLVPTSELAHARQVLSDQARAAAEDDEEDADYDPAKRRDRWKAWILLAWFVGPVAVVIVLVFLQRLANLVQRMFG
ncbi:MAG: hypothetical protein R3C52_13915 [Hyphomonadaceae bacterium]